MVSGVMCSRIMRLYEKFFFFFLMAIEKPMSKSANLIAGAETRWQLYNPNCFLDHLVIYFGLSRCDEIIYIVHYKDIKRKENY